MPRRTCKSRLRNRCGHNAYEGFFVGIQIANDDLLLGGKLIRGNDPGAMAAQKNSFRHLREAFAIHIASGQKDSDLFRNATAAAQVFVGHDMHSSRETVLRTRLTGSVPLRHRKVGRSSTGAMGDQCFLRGARARCWRCSRTPVQEIAASDELGFDPSRRRTLKAMKTVIRGAMR